MAEIVLIAQGIFERGLIFSWVVAAVYLTSKLIRFDNLSLEGAFGLGSAISALLVKGGTNAWLSFLIAALAGCTSGVATGMVHTVLGLNNLISGIVVTTALFSVTLALTGPSMAVGTTSTLFASFPVPSVYQPLVALALSTLLLFTLLRWFLTTEVGAVVRAVGTSPQMVTNVGKSTDFYLILTLALSNTLAAASGALLTQYVGYFSLWTSVGVLIVGLIGMLLGQIFSEGVGAALVMGSLVYQAIITLTFELRLDPSWNKLVTALLIIVVVVIRQRLYRQRAALC